MLCRFPHIVRLDRTIQYAAAFRFHRNCSGILDRPPSRTMTARQWPRHLGMLRPSLRAVSDRRPSLRGAKRHLPSLRAKRSNPSRHAKKEWIASSLALLAMTATIFAHPATGRTASHFKQPAVYRHGFAISPRVPREFCLNFPPSEIRGRRECRARDAPAASHAK